MMLSSDRFWSKLVLTAPAVYLQLFEAAREQPSSPVICKRASPSGACRVAARDHELHETERTSTSSEDDKEASIFTGAIVSGETAFKVLSRCAGLTKQDLMEIWSVADAQQLGYVHQTGFFLALALCALVQKGYSPQLYELSRLRELPTPSLRDLDSLLHELYAVAASRQVAFLPRWLQSASVDLLDRSFALQDEHSFRARKYISDDAPVLDQPPTSETTEPSRAMSVPADSGPGTVRGWALPAKETLRRYNSRFAHMLQWDSIEVTLVREKSGLIFKHITYTVTSQAHSSKVIRRYSDFESLHDCLVRRYPFRIIPHLPKKGKFGEHDDAFLEFRRVQLRRFLNFLGRHPVIKDEDFFQFFLKESSHDFQSKFKSFFKDVKEEPIVLFREGPHTLPDVSVYVSEMERKTKNLSETFELIVSICEKIAASSKELESDMKRISQQLGSLAFSSESFWDASCTHCQDLTSKFGELVEGFDKVAQTAQSKASIEEQPVTDNLRYILDVINSFQELFGKLNKLFAAREQASQSKQSSSSSSSLMSKIGTLNRKPSTSLKKDEAEQQFSSTSLPSSSLSSASLSLTPAADASPAGAGAPAVGRDAKQLFAVQCVWLESKLLHMYLSYIPQGFQLLVSSQVVGHQELSTAWSGLRFMIDSLLAGGDSFSTAML